MTPSSPPWFRIYSEVLNDRKLTRVAKVTGLPRALILGVWTGLLALASDSPMRGYLILTEDISFSVNDLADEVGLDAESLGKIIDEFVALDMLGWADGVLVVSHWDNRQFESDNSTERVRAWRQRQKEKRNDAPPEDETSQQRNRNVTVTPPEADSDTDSETDSTPTEAQAPPPAKPQAKKPKAKRTSAPPTPKQQESRAMFAAVAAACQINWRIGTEEQNNAVRQTERKLREDADAKPADVGEFMAFWNAHDWRGRRGEPPEPHQIREEWGRFEEWRKNGKPPQHKNGGKPDGPNRRPDRKRDPDETFLDPETGRLVRKDASTGKLVPVP